MNYLQLMNSADFVPFSVLTDDLSDLLREFDEVIEDFDNGEACQYEQHLEDMKRRTVSSMYDSGIDELESESRQGLFGSELNKPGFQCFSPFVWGNATSA